MSSLSIGKAWDEAREILARDGKLITSIALAMILVPQALAGVVAPPPNLSGVQPPAWTPAVTTLVLIAGIIGQIAIIRLALGPTTSVGEAIRHGARRALPALLALILFGVGLAVLLTPLFIGLAGMDALQAVAAEQPSPRAGGALLLVVLLIILISVRFQMLFPAAAGESGGPVKLIQRSWALTSGHYWKLLGFFGLVLVAGLIVLLMVQILGGIVAKLALGNVDPFTLGALLVALVSAAVQTGLTVVLSAMLARIYAQLSAGQASVPEVKHEG